MKKPAVLGLLCAAVLLVAYQQTSAKVGGVSLLVKPGQEHADATLVRNAPKEVSKLLGIPLKRVEKWDRRIEARTATQLKHGVHSMMLAANMTSMASCKGDHENCEPLAKNILAVAAEIEKECAEKYFDKSAFEQCEADIARPLCASTAKEFPNMCPFFTSKPTVDGGYIGGQDPANTEGEFCKACQQINAGSGCFAASSMVSARGRGAVPLSEVHAGDEIMSVGATGEGEWSRVVYAYTHVKDSPTVKLSWMQGGSEEGGTIELTGWHPLPVYTDSCGARYCGSARNAAAMDVRAGDRIYTLGGGGVATVSKVERGSTQVRYLLTSNSMMVVQGVVGAAYSTMAGSLETLPFLILSYFSPAALSSAPVEAALSAILESPALKAFEAAIHGLASANAKPVSASWMRSAAGAAVGAAPALSF